jgi:hypothetical protein
MRMMVCIHDAHLKQKDEDEGMEMMLIRRKILRERAALQTQ